MKPSRLAFFLERKGFVLPETGELAVFGARAESDLSMLPKDRLRLICGLKPDVDALQAAGYAVVTGLPHQAALALVFPPRAKAQARAMVAQALELAGVAIIDGQKHDGVDSLYRDLRVRADCGPAFSKAHGKTFVVQAGDDRLADWRQSGAASLNADGFVTVPGVFSADGIDPASKLLAAALPARPKGHYTYFGAVGGGLETEIV